MTNSTCYKDQLDTNSYYYWGKHKDKVGIVVHSTGANNPYIKRYVQPSKDDPNYDVIIADIGKNSNGNDWNHKARNAGVHAFIGLNAHDEVETYQVLPYEWAAWGVGRGTKGSYNYSPVSHIQFEICEGNLNDVKYFNAAFREAIEYCAYLCEQFGWDSSVICSHAESYKKGYGGNHSDCDHWLKKHGKTMDWFRAEVQKLLDENNKKSEVETKTEIVYVEYIIQSGDNLYNIAREYKTTINAIVEANNIINPSLVYPGDAIKIPVEKVVEVKPETPVAPEVKEIEYTIQRGDSLSKIAQKYGTTHQELAKYNGISNPSLIYVGQVIKIPNVKVEPPKEVIRRTHVVVAGDTLSEIAMRYGSTVNAIVEANKATYPKITPSHIIVGWILQIPTI